MRRASTVGRKPFRSLLVGSSPKLSEYFAAKPMLKIAGGLLPQNTSPALSCERVSETTMSCQYRAKAMKGSAGLTGLTGKNSMSAYVAGVKAGVNWLASQTKAGLAGLMIAEDRINRPIDYRAVETWEPLPVAEPIAGPLVRYHTCRRCGVKGAEKGGAWHTVSGNAYCERCLPTAFKEAGAGMRLGASKATTAPAAAITTQTASNDTQAPTADSRNLEQATAQLARMREPMIIKFTSADNQMRNLAVEGFRVKVLGQETGMALTRTHDPETAKPDGRWSVSHIDSGLELAAGIGRPAQALELAAELAQAGLDWDSIAYLAPLERSQQMEKARQILRRFEAKLAQKTSPPVARSSKISDESAMDTKETMRGLPNQYDTVRPSDLSPALRTVEGSLTDRIIFDSRQNPAYVLRDDGGEMLQVMGQDQQVAAMPRAEGQPLEAADYSALRIVPQFKPSVDHMCSGTRCDGKSVSDNRGERWYRIQGGVFCSHCAREQLLSRGEGYRLSEDYLARARQKAGWPVTT